MPASPSASSTSGPHEPGPPAKSRPQPPWRSSRLSATSRCAAGSRSDRRTSRSRTAGTCPRSRPRSSRRARRSPGPARRRSVGAHVRAHRRESLQHAADDVLVAGGEQVREVLDRDPQLVDRREDVVGVGIGARPAAPSTSDITGESGGTYQTIGSVRYSGCSGSAIRQSIASLQTGERCAASSQSSGIPSRRACSRTSGSCGSRKTSSCASSRSCSSGHRGGGLDAVGVVEHDAEVADAPDAGLRADRRQAGLDARVAERALLGLAGLPVEVDLLVGAAADAHAPAAALLLVDEHDAVLLALVHRARGTRGDARRVEAVLADARQVHHERLTRTRALTCSSTPSRRFGSSLTWLGPAAEVVLPVRAPLEVDRARR